MSTDLDYDDVYGEKRLETETLIAKKKQSKRPFKQAYRTSMRRSRWARRKARFELTQMYKTQKRELGNIFDNDNIGYELAVSKLKKSYGITY